MQFRFPIHPQVLGRWASGDGGRHKMVLGAASHGPALRRSGLDSVVLLSTEARAEFGSHPGDGAALFRDSTAPPQAGKGLEKVA